MNNKYWSIKEVSELYNINPNKLRFYEKKGLISPLRNPENDYRQYSKEDLVSVQLILTYRLLELPVERIKMLLESHHKDTLVNQLLEQLEMINKVVHKYKIMQKSISNVLDQYVESDSRNDLLTTVITAGQTVGQQLGYSESWEDKWDFDSWAESYDVTIRNMEATLSFYKNYDLVLDRVFELSITTVGAPARILDIGVGTGALASKYLETSIDVVGVDQSHKMLIEAKKKHPGLKLRVGDFMKLPFDDNSFTSVVSTYAFHHLNDLEKVYALEEMIRVLRPGGTIVIGDMMFTDRESRSSFLECLSVNDRNVVEDEYYTDLESLCGILVERGLPYTIEQVDELMHILKIEV